MPPVSIRPTQRHSALRLSSLPAIAALASAVAGTSLAANAPQIGVPQASAPQTGTPQTSATSVAVTQIGGAAELQKAVRDSVLAARARLGELQPWQQQLFSGEVLPQAEKFIREYRRQGAGFRVEVDEGLLRDYLAYFAPASLGVEDPQFLVRVEAEPGCISCGEALPSLRQVPYSSLAASSRLPDTRWSARDGAPPSTPKRSGPRHARHRPTSCVRPGSPSRTAGRSATHADELLSAAAR